MAADGSDRIELTPEARALLWMGCGGVKRASAAAQAAVNKWGENPVLPATTALPESLDCFSFPPLPLLHDGRRPLTLLSQGGFKSPT
jgi:hypothetical protein